MAPRDFEASESWFGLLLLLSSNTKMFCWLSSFKSIEVMNAYRSSSEFI